MAAPASAQGPSPERGWAAFCSAGALRPSPASGSPRLSGWDLEAPLPAPRPGPGLCNPTKYLAELCFARMRHHLKTLNPSKDYPRKWRQGDLGGPQSTARPRGPRRPRETSHPVHKRRRRGPPLVAPPRSARGREQWTDDSSHPDGLLPSLFLYTAGGQPRALLPGQSRGAEGSGSADAPGPPGGPARPRGYLPAARAARAAPAQPRALHSGRPSFLRPASAPPARPPSTILCADGADDDGE